MKHFVVLFVATVALALPTTIAGAAPASPSPADYRPQCEQGYQAVKPVLVPLITNAKALFGPMEKGLCGDQKHVPSGSLL